MSKPTREETTSNSTESEEEEDSSQEIVSDTVASEYDDPRTRREASLPRKEVQTQKYQSVDWLKAPTKEVRTRNGERINLLTFYQENREEFHEINNIGQDHNGEILVTYNKDKEKESLHTLTRIKDIINKQFPTESVKDLQKRDEENQEERMELSRDATINKGKEKFQQQDQ